MSRNKELASRLASITILWGVIGAWVDHFVHPGDSPVEGALIGVALAVVVAVVFVVVIVVAPGIARKRRIAKNCRDAAKRRELARKERRGW